MAKTDLALNALNGSINFIINYTCECIVALLTNTIAAAAAAADDDIAVSFSFACSANAACSIRYNVPLV